MIFKPIGAFQQVSLVSLSAPLEPQKYQMMKTHCKKSLEVAIMISEMPRK
jgi:hypothetical protein